jgi:type II secretory pathway pseudopilin PulG
MKSPLNSGRHRPAFTIIELLVALALVLFIMSIISQVFVDTSEAFRSQRAKAELSEKLRFITQTLRADLRSNHFENNRRISDDDFWDKGPPKVGYFRLEQDAQYSEISGLGVGVTEKSYISSDKSGTVMAFTSFLHGNDQRGFHSVNITGTEFLNWKTKSKLSSGDTRFEGTSSTYNSPNAEVAWFIDPSRSPPSFVLQDEPGSPSPTVQLFKLYRKVLPLLPETLPPGFEESVKPSADYQRTASVIPSQPYTVFNNAFSEEKPNVDVPMRRGIGIYLKNPDFASSWKTTFQGSNKLKDDDTLDYFLIADNVLSFTIEVLPKGSTQFATIFGNMEKNIFDTWCSRVGTDIYLPSSSPPISFNPLYPDFKSNWPGTDPVLAAPKWRGMLPQFTAIRVTIRLYDTNNALSPSKTTWQATVVEPL